MKRSDKSASFESADEKTKTHRIFSIGLPVGSTHSPGKVISYGRVARRLGYPRRARMVGWAMHQCPSGRGIPWHRVVGFDGALLTARRNDGPSVQRRLLELEGVRFIGERVDMSTQAWVIPLSGSGYRSAAKKLLNPALRDRR